MSKATTKVGKTLPQPKIVMPSVAEDKQIIAAAKADPDAQPLTPDQLKAMVLNQIRHGPICPNARST